MSHNIISITIDLSWTTLNTQNLVPIDSGTDLPHIQSLFVLTCHNRSLKTLTWGWENAVCVVVMEILLCAEFGGRKVCEETKIDYTIRQTVRRGGSNYWCGMALCPTN